MRRRTDPQNSKPRNDEREVTQNDCVLYDMYFTSILLLTKDGYQTSNYIVLRFINCHQLLATTVFERDLKEHSKCMRSKESLSRNKKEKSAKKQFWDVTT